MLVLGCIGWVRSHWRIDELWFGQSADRYELISNGGRLQLMRIRFWDEPFPLMYGSAPRIGELDRALAFETDNRAS